jgi:predicted nucleic acid binding AN1-type Zn finger protein
MGMIEDLSFLILLGLIAFVKLREKFKPQKNIKMKCAACGRTIFERPVKIKINDKELYFCCEHCAKAYSTKNSKD